MVRRRALASAGTTISSSLRPGFDLGMRPPADFQGDNRRLNMAAVTTWRAFEILSRAVGFLEN